MNDKSIQYQFYKNFDCLIIIYIIIDIPIIDDIKIGMSEIILNFNFTSLPKRKDIYMINDI